DPRSHPHPGPPRAAAARRPDRGGDPAALHHGRWPVSRDRGEAAERVLSSWAIELLAVGQEEAARAAELIANRTGGSEHAVERALAALPAEDRRHPAAVYLAD